MENNKTNTTTKPAPKYFRPTKEDIHIGYEIESHEWSMDEAGDPELNYDRWVPKKLEQPFVETILKYYKGSSIRVPYFDPKMLIQEGWTVEEQDDMLTYADKANFHLKHFKNHKHPVYSTIKILSYGDVVFYGICPSINEFRKIFNLINYGSYKPNV